MPVQILMPALSPTMTEGNLVRWNKAEGDSVRPGDVLAEIETDKATMEVEAVDEGVLGKIVVPAGSSGVKVNALIALLLEEGESADALATFAPASSLAPPSLATSGPASPAPVVTPALPPVASMPMPAPSNGRVKASPLARRLAQQRGVDLKTMQGSGPGGRIVRKDVEAFSVPTSSVASRQSQAALPARPAGSLYPAATTIPVSMVRKVIAQRLTESKQTIPHFYLTVDVEIDRLLALRQDYLKVIEPQKVSLNDFMIRALALALTRVPEANAMWQGDTIQQFQSVDVSVAVAIEGGLVTPILRDAQAKSVAALSTEMRGLAERARAGKLKPEEFQGGTVTLSNLGMFGVRQFAAIINPPQACILSVGASEERAVVRENRQIEVATVVTCTLSADHRVVDGAVGARLMAEFKTLLSEPLRLVL